MKKFTLLFLLFFAIAAIHAQNYQISFAGTGASTTVDSVQVENLSQCTHTALGGSDILHLQGIVGINELNTGNNTLHIYPNPTTGDCSVDFEATAQGEATIGLYDVSGKRILQVQELLSKGHHTYSMSGISSGAYTLKIESDNYSYTAKIVSNNVTSGVVQIKQIETFQSIDNQNNGTTDGLKGSKSVIPMQYNTGDRLKLTGKSGIYRTVFMLIPTSDQTVTFNFIACTDADNNNYSVVVIGTQTWMAENLKTSKYSNGSTIPNVTVDTSWNNLTTGACCDYSNTPSNSSIYGKFYNWYAVSDANNICPAGWHAPVITEWTTLITYLGGSTVAGGKLKKNCTTLWQTPNVGATNETGFTALPGGYRPANGLFLQLGNYGNWWSSTSASTYIGSYVGMGYNYGDISSITGGKKMGFSVRCVKN